MRLEQLKKPIKLLLLPILMSANSASCRSSDKSTPRPQKTATAAEIAATSAAPALSPGPTPKIRKFAGFALDKKIDASSCPDYKTLAQQNFHCKFAAVCDPCWVNTSQWEDLHKPLPHRGSMYYIRIMPEKLKLPPNVKIKARVLEEAWPLYDTYANDKDVLGLGGEFEIDGFPTMGVALHFVDGVPRVQLTKPKGFSELIEGKAKVRIATGPREIVRSGKVMRVFGYGSVEILSPLTFCGLDLPAKSFITDLYEISVPKVVLKDGTQITKEIESYHRVISPKPGIKYDYQDHSTYRVFHIRYLKDDLWCDATEIDQSV